MSGLWSRCLHWVLLMECVQICKKDSLEMSSWKKDCNNKKNILNNVYLIMLSLQIIWPLPGTSLSFSAVSDSKMNVNKPTIISFAALFHLHEVHRKTDGLISGRYFWVIFGKSHTLLLQGDHCAFIFAFIQLLQDLHQFSDTSCKSVKTYEIKWCDK